MLRTLTLSTIVALAAAGASAQDWTGAYAGGQLGYLGVDTDNGLSGDDFSYGLHAGYTYEFPSGFVLGGEVEYDWMDVDLDGAADVENVLRGKAILGFSQGAVLPYALAGFTEVDTTIGSGDGWLAGAGVAWEFQPQIALSGEVIYHEFSDIGATNVDADATSLNLRVSYRF